MILFTTAGHPPYPYRFIVQRIVCAPDSIHVVQTIEVHARKDLFANEATYIAFRAMHYSDQIVYVYQKIEAMIDQKINPLTDDEAPQLMAGVLQRLVWPLSKNPQML